MSIRGTATERLRELLNKRGVEHRDTTPDVLDDWKNWVTEVRLDDGRWFRVIERQTGDFTFEGFGLNPEQTVKAMLGRGKCRIERRPSAWGGFTEHCGNCGADLGCDTRNTQHFCPNCGEELVR